MRIPAQAALIEQELLLVPNGDNAPQRCRMVYEIPALRDLKGHDAPRSAGQVREEAVQDVRQHYVGFVPIVTDSDYFDLRPNQYQSPN